jgi:hypothetical protein
LRALYAVSGPVDGVDPLLLTKTDFQSTGDLNPAGAQITAPVTAPSTEDEQLTETVKRLKTEITTLKTEITTLNNENTTLIQTIRQICADHPDWNRMTREFMLLCDKLNANYYAGFAYVLRIGLATYNKRGLPDNDANAYLPLIRTLEEADYPNLVLLRIGQSQKCINRILTHQKSFRSATTSMVISASIGPLKMEAWANALMEMAGHNRYHSWFLLTLDEEQRFADEVRHMMCDDVAMM